MKRKSAATLEEARALARVGPWNGAASRAYYAACQAIVGEFQQRGLRAPDFGQADPRHPEKWPHWLVVANCRAVGLSRSEADVVQKAERERVRADYGRDGVSSWVVQEVLAELPPILDGLGVRLRKEGDPS